MGHGFSYSITDKLKEKRSSIRGPVVTGEFSENFITWGLLKVLLLPIPIIQKFLLPTYKGRDFSKEH